MNIQKQLFNLELASNSILLELLQLLLEPSLKKIWLQKVANLLKQTFSANFIYLRTFIDNSWVYSLEDNSLKETDVNYGDLLKDNIISNTWIDGKYLVPLSHEGILILKWKQIPTQEELKAYNSIFLFLEIALKNRSKLLFEKKDVHLKDSLWKIEKLLNSEPGLKNKLNLVSKEICLTLNSSRCQLKIFSANKDLIGDYDPLYTTEYINGDFLPAISVISNFEKEWINKLKTDKNLFLQLNQLNSSLNFVNNIEILLCIKSIFGCPIIFKGEVMGVLVLHQCDYEKEWKQDELFYLKQVLLLLSLLIGSEIEKNKKDDIVNADNFLRELSHVQIEAQVKKSCFSLIMVDIERLREINLKMGFVAGDLVLSQTARYLKRLYKDKQLLARYNSDEFVVIMKDVDAQKAKLEAENLKEHLKNVSVLGVGPVEYNFSFVTFPTHALSIVELLTLLEQAMLVSKSRGRFQVSSFDEVQGKREKNWNELLTNAIPEIILKKSSLKTGPDVIENIKSHLGKQKSCYNADILDSVQSLALALDAKDSYTEGHSKRVSEYAFMLAKYLGLDQIDIEWIRLAASMHDIGKIGIPENILCKPGKLTKEEYEVMKNHSVIGARILKPIKPLEKVTNLVLYHHEYWDGSGYPNGLSKTEIPVGSRIVSIVDAYQAMTSTRPYRSALPMEEAISRLKAGKEKQWDPDLTDAFIKILT